MTFAARAGLLLLLFSMLPQPVAPQERTASAPLRVFIDCNFFCDENFLRSELDFIDHVRDRRDAHVHVLATRQDTGGGGDEYTLEFIGLRSFASQRDTLRYFAAEDATDDERRRGLARTIRLGLVPYLLTTPLAQHLDVTVSRPSGTAAATSAVDDPWNFWVFRLSLNGFMNGESRQRFGNFNGSVNANRTTEQWKAALSLNGNTSRSRFEIDDTTTATSERHSYGVSTLVVKSIGSRFASGGRLSASSSNFVNQRLALRLSPAVEYSVFPYAESTRRLVTILYSVGIAHVQYEEITIYGKTQETLPFESLQLSYDVTQPWGSLDLEAEAFHYLHDPWQRYRGILDGNVDVRLFKGFSLEVGGNVQYVRDQIHLSAADLTPEEVLLQRRERETSYRYFMHFGVAYSFGSIYNNVVNPRLRF